MLRSYKYRIYPTEQQTEQINKHFGCCRTVYNLALNIKQEAYRTQNKYLSAIDLCYQLPELKKEFEYFKEIDSQALQASIKKLDVAYKNFFKYGSGFPKYKNKHTKQSFSCPNNTRRVNWSKQTLDLPKIKSIPIAISRKFKGEIKTITISRTPTFKYFASILVDNKKELPKKPKIKASTTIGIDLGLMHFATLSNGKVIDNPRYLKSNMQRLKVLQRRLSKKVKGSSNRNKARLVVAKQHEKIHNQRTNFLHNISTTLIRENQTICVEDLNVKGMSARCKPKQDEEGKYLLNGQSAKSGLNRSITDAGWGMFQTMLQYKSGWYGNNYIEVDRFYPSSKKCNDCGEINKTLTLKNRKWLCANCGKLNMRDDNASRNIKDEGLKTYTRHGESQMRSGGEPVERSALAGAMKQEVNISTCL